MVGRKPASYNFGPLIRVNIPIFTIYALSEKEHYAEKVYEKDFEERKNMLQKQGYKIIKTIQEDWSYLPRYCPKCCHEGHPIFTEYGRARSESRKSPFRKDYTRFKLHYNHSKPKSHQCFIGYLISGYLQLSKKIDLTKMNPENWIKPHKLEWFDAPKVKKSRRLS